MPVAALADGAAREEAVTRVDANLCVTASAGSGKTSLLIERILFALLARGTPLHRIVAITFTERAAAELRARLRGALQAVVAPGADRTPNGEATRTLARLARLAPAPPDAEQVRARAAAALDAEATLATIHSFALGLLHRHPVEARLPAGVTLDLGEGFRRHLRERLPASVTRALERGAGDLAEVLARIGLAELRELIEQLAWRSDAPRAAAADPFALLRPTVAGLEATLRQERAALQLERRQQEALRDEWDHLLAALQQVLAQGDAGGPWRFDGEIRATIEKDKLSKSRPPQAAFDIEAAAARLVEAQRLLRQLLRVDEPFITAVLAAVRPLAHELRESFTATGTITADGALAAAAALLRDHPRVRRAEAAAIDQLLIDEFQDTDPLQCELALFLAQADVADQEPPAHHAAEVRLAPGKLFLVGDPKQSIYRFRGADLDVFARTTEQVLAQGGRQLTLTTSFRSPPELVEPVNAICAPWMDATTTAEPPYSPLVSPRARDPAGAAGVEIWTVVRPDGDLQADARRDAEGRAIAEGVLRLQREGVACGKIVILLRSLSNLHHYVQPLRSRAIPFVVGGGSTFVRRSEVHELYSLLLAAADPDDGVACLGALRSTLLAVPDAAIHAAATRAPATRLQRLCWRDLVAAPEAELRSAAARLAALHDDLARLPVALAVERFVEGSLLLPVAASARDGDQRVANLRKLAARVVEAAAVRRTPLAELLREMVQRGEQVETDREGSLADADLDAVRVLTIHAAKGLEFDVVIVGDLARGAGGARGPRVGVRRIEADGGERLAVEIAGTGVAGGAVTNLAQIVRAQRDRLHEAAENKRLFYVAATRAKERLILIAGAATGARSPWLEALSHVGYTAGAAARDGAQVCHADVRHRQVEPQARPATRGSEQATDGDALRASVQALDAAVRAARSVGGRFERPSAHAEPDNLAPAEARSSSGPADNGAQRLARAVGVAAHLALARTPLGQVPDVLEVTAAAASAARAEWLDADDVARAAVELLHASPARRLIEELRAVDLLAVEWPLTLARGGRLWHGAADLLFLEGGRIVVADWKSDRDADFDRLAAHYRPQLEIYAAAFAAAERGREVPGLELLLLRHGRRLRL